MSLGTVVMALEGVLAGRGDDVDLSTSQLDLVGQGLYTGLARNSRLVLATGIERRYVDHWCRLVGLAGHAAVTQLDERVVQRLRAGGENVELVIDADPERAATFLRQGVATMLLTRPLFARAGHRPDLPQVQRPWAAIVAEQQLQRGARAVTVVDDDQYED